jgi:hypothetical protein
MATYLANADIGQQVSVERTRVRNRQQLERIGAGDDSDVLHFVGHSVTGPYIEFMLGDEKLSAAELAGMLGTASRPRLVVLDTCESARSFPYSTPSFSNNPAFLISRAGSYAIGTTGWLEVSTADEFYQSFYANITRGVDIEESVRNAKRDLSLIDKEWWVFSLYGPLPSE